MSLRRGALLSLLTLGAACTAGSPVTVDQDIRGGRVEAGYPAVGILRMENGSFCTGTLIAEDVVLTAAHCLRETAVSFHLGSGKPVTDFKSTEAIDTMTKHAVLEQVGHPGLAAPPNPVCPSASLDIALVKLAEPVREAPPDPVAFRVPELGEACTTVGFGRQDRYFHEKRSATQKLRQVRDTALGFDAFRVSTEGGDSGGPIYCGDAIVAVNSCGSAPDWFARLDEAEPWIRAMLADWDPAAAAALAKMPAPLDGGR